MAKSVNKVILLGRLGNDVDLSYTPSGTARGKFSLATDRSYKKGDIWQTETEWHRVVVWGRLAEVCGEYLGKGDQVYIEGRIQTRTWDKDGQKHYATEIVAESAVFLKTKGSGSQGSGDSGGFGFGAEDDDAPF